MKEFDKILNEQIDKLDENYVNSVLAAHNKVQETEATLRAQKDILEHAVESLCAYLALEIRKRMPKLNVHLANGTCNIQYRSKSLSISPNIAQAKWEIEPTDMGRGFVRGYSHVLPLQNDMSAIADAAIEHFSNNYKTIQKETGMGESAVSGGAINAGRPIKQKGKSKPGTGYYG